MAVNASYTQSVRQLAQDDLWLRDILYKIRMCFLPIILAGTITNIFNFIVLRTKVMRRLSTSVYLLALACADVGVMYFELFRVWFEWMDFLDPAVYFSDVYCKLANYFNGISRDFSNWLIACLAAERVVMVACPYKAREVCTVSKARVVILALLSVVCVPHVYSLVFSVAQKHTWWVCWEDPDSEIAPIVAAVVEFSIGYTVVLVVFILNIVMVALICNKKLALSQSAAVASSNGHHNKHGRRLTRTLLLVAVVFLVCETPRIIMSFVCKFSHRTALKRIILNASYVLSGINHASNFIIYILSSQRFRRLFINTLKVAKYKILRSKGPVVQNHSRLMSGQHTSGH